MRKALLLLLAAAVILVGVGSPLLAAMADAGRTVDASVGAADISTVWEKMPVPEETPVSTPSGRGIDPDKPMVALTFDDGPSENTDRLLDIFAQYGGKCTLFMLGQAMDRYADTLVRAAEEGHEIASHSWYHPELTSLDDQGITDQIEDTREKIFEITGRDARLLRPPYGSTDDRVVTAAEHEGVALINWSVDTMDWDSLNADAVYEVVMEEAYDGAIILCHDYHRTTVDAMERVVPALIEAGYQLVTVTELLTARGGEVTAGVVYFDQRDYY